MCGCDFENFPFGDVFIDLVAILLISTCFSIFSYFSLRNSRLLYLLVAALFFLWPTIAFLFFIWLPPISSLGSVSGPIKHRHEVIIARHGAVATDDKRCSRIGMKVLREGGHAVDASVAAALCLGVVSPASSGIGGGAFMLLRLASGKAQAFDMRETAPLHASVVLHITLLVYFH